MRNVASSRSQSHRTSSGSHFSEKSGNSNLRNSRSSEKYVFPEPSPELSPSKTVTLIQRLDTVIPALKNESYYHNHDMNTSVMSFLSDVVEPPFAGIIRRDKKKIKEMIIQGTLINPPINVHVVYMLMYNSHYNQIRTEITIGYKKIDLGIYPIRVPTVTKAKFVGKSVVNRRVLNNNTNVPYIYNDYVRAQKNSDPNDAANIHKIFSKSSYPRAHVEYNNEIDNNTVLVDHDQVDWSDDIGEGSPQEEDIIANIRNKGKKQRARHNATIKKQRKSSKKNSQYFSF
jgi:hypothetical protein